LPSATRVHPETDRPRHRQPTAGSAGRRVRSIHPDLGAPVEEAVRWRRGRTGRRWTRARATSAIIIVAIVILVIVVVVRAMSRTNPIVIVVIIIARQKHAALVRGITGGSRRSTDVTGIDRSNGGCGCSGKQRGESGRRGEEGEGELHDPGSWLGNAAGFAP
jgi:hypothetical protein